MNGSGTDILQLGGSGTGFFDMSQINVIYFGFSSFNVTSGDWNILGLGNKNWNIGSSATMELASGAQLAGNVTFTGAPATLQFDVGTFQLGGKIIGMANQDAVDFRYIPFSAGDQAVWFQGAGQGTLALVTSLGAGLASVTLQGTYTTANFTAADDGHGGTIITDPPAVVTVDNGAVVDPQTSDAAVTFVGPTGTLQINQSASFKGTISGFNGQDQIDLTDMAFSANNSIGYAANSTNSGGNLMVSSGGNSANIALLGNYIASSFAMSSDGHGGTLISEAAMTASQTTPLTHAHT